MLTHPRGSPPLGVVGWGAANPPHQSGHREGCGFTRARTVLIDCANHVVAGVAHVCHFAVVCHTLTRVQSMPSPFSEGQNRQPGVGVGEDRPGGRRKGLPKWLHPCGPADCHQRTMQWSGPQSRRTTATTLTPQTSDLTLTMNGVRDEFSPKAEQKLDEFETTMPAVGMVYDSRRVFPDSEPPVSLVVFRRSHSFVATLAPVL